MIKETNFITANNILFGSGYGKAGTITQIQNDILSDFEDSPSYQTVIINSISRKVQITTLTNQSTKENYKKILSLPNESFNVGDIVVWGSLTFLITDIDEDQQIQFKGKIQLCNNTLTFYSTTDSTIHQIPCIISKSLSLKNDENKYIITADNEFYLQVGSNNITKQIKPDSIYKIGVSSYKVLTIFDDISIPGLLTFKLGYSEQSQETHVFTVEILNGSSIQIAQSQPLTINTQVSDNGNIISPSPALLYSSSNEVIATINNSGVVSFLTVGTVIFTVSLASDSNVKDTISVEVTEDATHNYTVEISGNTSIIKDKSANYTCVFKDNGVQMSNISSVFYLTADDGISATTLASITSQDGVANSCIVTAGSTLGYVKLWVKNDDETIVSSSFRIQIKNIF